jgi:hypothetical protein
VGNKKQKGQRKKVPKGATARDDGKTITFFTHNRYLLVLALAALLIHAIVLLDYLNSPFAQSPEWDAKVYWNWAKSIAAGDWMGKFSSDFDKHLRRKSYPGIRGARNHKRLIRGFGLHDCLESR